jgi:hypothetical protein
MAEHYAKQVNQKKLAAAAVLKWESADAGRTWNEFDPNLQNIASMLVKRRRCSRLFGA